MPYQLTEVIKVWPC